jgi:hypothetical protein
MLKKTLEGLYMLKNHKKLRHESLRLKSDKFQIAVHTENPTRYNNVSKFIIPYLYEAQHVSGDTPPIIRGLKCTGSLWFFMRERLLDV